MPILRDAGELKRPVGAVRARRRRGGRVRALVVVALCSPAAASRASPSASCSPSWPSPCSPSSRCARGRPVPSRPSTTRWRRAASSPCALPGRSSGSCSWRASSGSTSSSRVRSGPACRLVTKGEKTEDMRLRLETIGFGFVIPIFFVVTGMEFDLAALFDSPTNLPRLPFSWRCSSWLEACRCSCSTARRFRRRTGCRWRSTPRRRFPWSSRSRRSGSRQGTCAPTRLLRRRHCHSSSFSSRRPHRPAP